VEIAVALAAAEGEEVSGDQHVAVRCDGGALVAAIDGLGHGAAAGEAAQIAVRVLTEHCDDPLPGLVERCHAALAETRGVALTLARIDTDAHVLTWLGVGNVEGRLLRDDEDGALHPPPEAAMLLGGVVGDQLPPLHAVTLPIDVGDTVMLATDGLDPEIGGRRTVRGALAPLADGLLYRHRRGRDDALVLLARLLPSED
jgi:negative regulator of sigma-B (phosphoserine phosphatase)